MTLGSTMLPNRNSLDSNHGAEVTAKHRTFLKDSILVGTSISEPHSFIKYLFKQDLLL